MILLLLAACAYTGEGAPYGLVRFGFPVAEADRIERTIGVDHDPVDQEGTLGGAICVDHAGRGFPHCYDGHRGSDYVLLGGFDAMDAGSAMAVAAASGRVVEVEDGHYDRCHILGTGISCDGHDGIPNKVVIEHAFGVRSLYYHFKKDTIEVAVGDEVRCGDPLGMLGSSGYSALPHLHFQVEYPDGTVVDPYAGPSSQEASWWWEQGEEDELPGPGCTTW